MKNIFTLLAISLALAACNSKQKNADASHDQDTSGTSTEQQFQKSPAVQGDSIVWAKVPELKNMGTFPFFVPPADLVMDNSKDGLSEIFDYALFNNYTGSGIYPTKGRLGVMIFVENNGKAFNKLKFDDTFDAWIDKSGALMIYEGLFPSDEGARQKLKENLFNGKKRTVGLSDDEPFAVYAFKANGKKYVINVQSNTAEGTIFVMELK